MKNIEELKELLIERGCEDDTTFFTNPSFIEAVIGISNENRVIYSYNKMVKSLMDNDNMTEEEAVEFIDYNTMRTIPYMGLYAPIICEEIE